MKPEPIANSFCSNESCGYYRHASSIFDESIRRNNVDSRRLFTFRTLLSLY